MSSKRKKELTLVMIFAILFIFFNGIGTSLFEGCNNKPYTIDKHSQPLTSDQIDSLNTSMKVWIEESGNYIHVKIDNPTPTRIEKITVAFRSNKENFSVIEEMHPLEHDYAAYNGVGVYIGNLYNREIRNLQENGFSAEVIGGVIARYDTVWKSVRLDSIQPLQRPRPNFD